MNLLYKAADNKKDVLVLYLAFVGLFVVNAILDSNLLTPDRLCTVILQATPFVLISMGQTMVMLTGGIDLSVGSVIALMTCIASYVMNPEGLGLIGGMVIIILSGILIGAVNGAIITFGRIPAIIVTLATSFVWHGISLVLRQTPGGTIDTGFMKWISGGTETFSGFVLILIALLFWMYIKRTRLGNNVFAVGDNESAAYASGIGVNKTRIIAYMIAGLFIAMAGITLSGITGSGDANIGRTYTMNSIAASVLGGASFLGGRGVMRGTLVGALLITTLMNTLFFSGLSPFYQNIVQGIILIAAVSMNVFGNRRRGN